MTRKNEHIRELSKECSGCMACENICPVGAIKIVTSDTFRYPVVDEKACIGCGLCKNVCQVEHSEINYGKLPQTCFVGKTKKDEDYLNCSSGGAFRCIVKAWLESSNEDAFVCGCSMDENFLVYHEAIPVSAIEQVDRFTHSKYVQSDMRKCYCEIADLLKKGKRVLFSGVPCQVAALQLFLHVKGVDSSKLFLVECVCVGPLSNEVFLEMIKADEKERGKKLCSYQFRIKEQLDNGTFYTRSCKKQYEDGTVIRASRLEDKILDMFYIGTNKKLRQSCYECVFRTPARIGDITIGDAWGIQKIYPEFNPFVGISSVCVNTEKGQLLEKKICEQMIYKEVTYDVLTADNHGYRKEK